MLHVIFVEVLARLNKDKFSGKTYVQVIFAHFLARLYMGNSAWYIYSLARTCAKIYIYMYIYYNIYYIYIYIYIYNIYIYI